ncbi:hypothetical protein SCHPADRAFT_379889 [Schizopora paradoxa]|uniref:Uncharacterized protein n=1 Tax=Schizopora paradoxa TaxID=27342 RepID=A0A0H2RUM5_9AGAM|nr:hypothetical protein SCHPADRAFT_379889 [Schizopora paradoxa]
MQEHRHDVQPIPYYGGQGLFANNHTTQTLFPNHSRVLPTAFNEWGHPLNTQQAINWNEQGSFVSKPIAPPELHHQDHGHHAPTITNVDAQVFEWFNASAYENLDVFSPKNLDTRRQPPAFSDFSDGLRFSEHNFSMHTLLNLHQLHAQPFVASSDDCQFVRLS